MPCQNPAGKSPESSVVSAHVLGSLILPLFSMNLPIQKKNMAALVTSTFTSTLHLPQANPKSKIPDTKLNSITENRKKKQKQQKNKDSRERLGGHSCWIFVFFLFPSFFVFFLVFQGFSNVFLVLVTFSHLHLFLAVRCLHAFKLAGTNRLTTAAMNILGLRIKTVCSNFEMFGHVLDNNLSFMLYFLKNVA